MSRRHYVRYGLPGADVEWKAPQPPRRPEMPGNARLVLHRLRAWRDQGRPFMNARELAKACGLAEGTVYAALKWLDQHKLINDRREPTR